MTRVLCTSLLASTWVGIDLGREPTPGETMVGKFRHLLETYNVGDQLFDMIATYLLKQGLKISIDTIVDATNIATPSSIKNQDKVISGTSV